jgi:hypothetical protein
MTRCAARAADAYRSAVFFDGLSLAFSPLLPCQPASPAFP